MTNYRLASYPYENNSYVFTQLIDVLLLQTITIEKGTETSMSVGASLELPFGIGVNAMGTVTDSIKRAVTNTNSQSVGGSVDMFSETTHTVKVTAHQGQMLLIQQVGAMTIRQRMVHFR